MRAVAFYRGYVYTIPFHPAPVCLDFVQQTGNILKLSITSPRVSNFIRMTIHLFLGGPSGCAAGIFPVKSLFEENFRLTRIIEGKISD